ncbi:MAG: DUF4342 domain-containing protein [Tissierellia bacterium]|nr:DUF4342 domain-containing protein [Tissierellia bacterium]
MITLEQVEKLRDKANVSYEEARAALEETNGDILEAIIKLEKQNRIKAPEGGGYFSTKKSQQYREDNIAGKKVKEESKIDQGTSFGELIGKLIRWCGRIINKGNRNHLNVIKDGENIMTIPITVLVLFLFIMFWVVIPIMVVGLFFGYRYVFSGPDLGKENVNRALDSVADAAENLKKEVKGEKYNGEDSDN